MPYPLLVVATVLVIAVLLFAGFTLWRRRAGRRRGTDGHPVPEPDPPVGSVVMIKFHDHVDVPYVDGLERRLDEFSLGAGSAALRDFPGVAIDRTFNLIEPRELRELMARDAPGGGGQRRMNFLTFFTAHCPAGIDPEALARAIATWPTVETAYVHAPVAPAWFDPGDDPRYGNQGYLKPGPHGIGAEPMWAFANALGETQRVVSVEEGWLLTHEDLVDSAIGVIHGINHGNLAHGAGVLGVMVASDNTRGGVGIAPRANASVSSVWMTQTVRNTPAAIQAAIQHLSQGDTLVIAMDTEIKHPITGEILRLPVETNRHTLAAIQVAVSRGIVVVAAAGNGGRDLAVMDNFTDLQEFPDSGAILVGAVSSTLDHSRLDFSNYGTRVDCYAWGENVDTCWFNGGHPNVNISEYTATFNGTSSACAIVAGAVLLLQGFIHKHTGSRLAPVEIRNILKDRSTGTDVFYVDRTKTPTPPPVRIGSMPDLSKIIVKYFPELLSTKIYLRDSPADIGEPHDTFLSASPDIILRSLQVPDPWKSFGEGSGTESSVALSEPATKGSDHFVYVRVRNKGSAPAHNVVASVWYALPATLVTPQAWIPVGARIIPMVPAGDVLTVSPPILWPAVAIPDAGHYCFIATIGTPDLPAPRPEQLMAWDAFLDFVRKSNQVSWRNFNVVPASAAAKSGGMEFAFLSPGAPDLDRPMTLEVIATLPRGSQAALDVPATLLAALRESQVEFEPDRRRTLGRARVDPTGTTLVGEFLFPAGSRSELTLHVQIADDAPPAPYQVAVRQLFQGQEVGRVTWRLMPDTSPGSRAIAGVL